MDHAFDESHAIAAPAAPQVRHVGVGAPIQWLRLGAQDLQQSLRPSLRVGLLVAAAGWVLLLATWGIAYLVPALTGGFLLVAPFAAILVYGLTRQLERGEPLDPAAARRAWRANAQSIALFGFMLAVVLIFWERIAAIIFAAFYRGEPLAVANLMTALVFSPAHLPLVLSLGAAGALIAAVVFALSVVSVPMLLDRPVDIITAVIASVQSCLRNPLPMLFWALLIAVITWIGLLTFMVGLVVVFPWLAHASWHAYRALVAFEE